jgi:protein SCO1
MKAYLKRYSAKPGWDFLTGSKHDIGRVIKAFNALGVFSVNKMEHYPLILVRAPSDSRWIRIFGLIGTTELMKEYKGAAK